MRHRAAASSQTTRPQPHRQDPASSYTRKDGWSERPESRLELIVPERQVNLRCSPIAVRVPLSHAQSRNVRHEPCGETFECSSAAELWPPELRYPSPQLIGVENRIRCVSVGHGYCGLAVISCSASLRSNLVSRSSRARNVVCTIVPASLLSTRVASPPDETARRVRTPVARIVWRSRGSIAPVA
jgi:hypothetical protein